MHIHYKHVKSGRLYEMIDDDAKLEATLDRVCVYRSMEDSTVWVRPHAEFFDGRFEVMTQF